MGRALASIIEQADEAKRTDALAPLLNPDAHELPVEADVRALLEAAAIDVDAAIDAARADGDLFEGDEVAAGSEIQAANGGRILEAVGKGDKPGTTRYKVAVIRPGRAQGTGRRYYSRRMLEANAANFGAQPMFWNHEDLKVILERGHGSRDPRDLCGWLQEGTWWDPNHTAPDDAKEHRPAGAVMGHTDLDDAAADLIAKFPQALAVSVNMDSTRIAVGRADDGNLAPLVEGVVKGSGSLDLITGKAGAGGQVLERLRESAEARYGADDADPATLDDAQLIEAARSRPAVLAALQQPAPPPEPEDPVVTDPDPKLVEARLADLEAKLLASEESATDPARLVEAAQSNPDFAARLVEVVAASPEFDRIVEAKVAEREDEARDEARAEGRRELALRDMRDEATRLIEARAAGTPGGILTPAFTDDLRGRYTLRDGHPSPALDLHDELSDDGTVAKAAIERLREAVEVDIAREERKLREAMPTRIRDLAAPEPSRDDGGEPPPPAAPDDPTAVSLGLDPVKVREFQGV
jgi:hypothetical protein